MASPETFTYLSNKISIKLSWIEAVMDSLKEILVDLHQKNVDLENTVSGRNKELQKGLQQVLKFTEAIEAAWSGYWLKPYANLYFQDFQKPAAHDLFDPQRARLFGFARGWMSVEYSDIEEAVQGSIDFDVPQAETEISNHLERTKDLHEYLCNELLVFKSYQEFEEILKDLDEIEGIEWGITTLDYVELRKPKTLVGNLDDIQRGVDIPPHIRYQAGIVWLLSSIAAISDFIKRTRRLIKKLEIRQNVVQAKPETFNGVKSVVKLCNSFHNVARQLRRRHEDRETLIVNDEYDVQDLFYALLKVFFEDIRAEEWTPSYANTSSRVDFLLKREGIVIEIKKTRNNLGVKEVSNQLLIDIARYQSHPDCKNLICFVYDPEGRIGNPKGVEDDLNSLSNERINITALIRPV